MIRNSYKEIDHLFKHQHGKTAKERVGERKQSAKIKWCRWWQFAVVFHQSFPKWRSNTAASPPASSMLYKLLIVSGGGVAANLKGFEKKQAKVVSEFAARQEMQPIPQLFFCFFVRMGSNLFQEMVQIFLHAIRSHERNQSLGFYNAPQ